MDYKQQIILTNGEDFEVVNAKSISSVLHQNESQGYDDSYQTYYFKLRISDGDHVSTEFVDNYAKYSCHSFPLKGNAIYTGSSEWLTSYDDVKRLWERGDVKISLGFKESLSDKIHLDVLPMSFSDVTSFYFITSQVANACEVAPYGFKFSIVSNPNIDENIDISELYFTYIPKNLEDVKRNNGFHEVVVRQYDSVFVTQKIMKSIYMETATIYDLLYSEIVKKFNKNNSNEIVRNSSKEVITRDWLISFFKQFDKEKMLHIDLGGEGYFFEKGYASGFSDAINLNSTKINSQLRNIPECYIPHLIFVEDWASVSFPFADNTIDLLTLQAIPIPQKGGVFEQEYNEICRCMECKGRISIWCMNIGNDNENDAKLANDFFDYYSCRVQANTGCFICDLDFDEKNNQYISFYNNLPHINLCVNGFCGQMIPVTVQKEEVNYLSFDKSVILHFDFGYPEKDAVEPSDTSNPAGFVTFDSGGGYTVEFILKYTLNGNIIEKNTGRLLLGNKKTYDLPAGASEYEVTCRAWNGSSWKNKFDTYKSDTPFNCTFRTYGALPNPKMEIIKD